MKKGIQIRQRKGLQITFASMWDWEHAEIKFWKTIPWALLNWLGKARIAWKDD
jgi:hypothetical protein